jgi:hypothetical protein
MKYENGAIIRLSILSIKLDDNKSPAGIGRAECSALKAHLLRAIAFVVPNRWLRRRLSDGWRE